MYFKRGELCDESSHLVVKKLPGGEPMGRVRSGECAESAGYAGRIRCLGFWVRPQFILFFLNRVLNSTTDFAWTCSSSSWFHS
jgi:hypothetical protein